MWCATFVNPFFAENLGSVKSIGVLNSVNSLTCSNTVGIVSVGVAVKALQLAALLPGQGMTQIGGRITLLILVYPHSPVMSISEKQNGQVLFFASS